MFYAHPDVLDNGLEYIRANCNKLALVPSYTSGATYAAVSAAILAEADTAPADLVLSTVGTSRVLTVAAKTDTAANATGGGADTHTVLLDTVNSKVLYVTEESGGQTITAGNAVNIGSFTITRTQPVAA